MEKSERFCVREIEKESQDSQCRILKNFHPADLPGGWILCEAAAGDIEPPHERSDDRNRENQEHCREKKGTPVCKRPK
jgi:hypothetical protein